MDKITRTLWGKMQLIVRLLYQRTTPVTRELPVQDEDLDATLPYVDDKAVQIMDRAMTGPIQCKCVEMEEGKNRSTIEEAASDFQEYTESTIPSDENDDCVEEYQAMAEEIDTDKLVDKMSQKELEEIEGARAEDYGKAKEE